MFSFWWGSGAPTTKLTITCSRWNCRNHEFGFVIQLLISEDRYSGKGILSHASHSRIVREHFPTRATPIFHMDVLLHVILGALISIQREIHVAQLIWKENESITFWALEKLRSIQILKEFFFLWPYGRVVDLLYLGKIKLLSLIWVQHGGCCK